MKICYHGGPGTGKTDRILKRFVEYSQRNKHPLLLLPTRGLADHIRYRLLTERPDFGNALREDRILTFEQWAANMVGPNEIVVAPNDLLPLIREILGRIRPPAFEKVQDLPGFPRSIARALAEVLENRIEAPKDATPRIEGLLQLADELARSMAEHNLVLRGQLLQRRTDEILDKKKNIPQVLLIDGFYDFTPGQHRCLKTLIPLCECFFATLPVSDAELTKPRRSSSAISKTHRFLKSIGVTFEPLSAPPRNQKAVHQLFSNLFTAAKIEGDDSLMVLEADTRHHLIDELARMIRRSKDDANGGIERWGEFGLIARNLAPYADLVRRIFSEYGIPVAVHTSIAPGEIGPGPALLAFVRALGEPQSDSAIDRVNHLGTMLEGAYLFVDADTARALRYCADLDKTAKSIGYRKKPCETLEALAASEAILSTLPEPLQRRVQTWLNDTIAKRCKATEGPMPFADFARLIRELVQDFARPAFAPKTDNTAEDTLHRHDAAVAVRGFLQALERESELAERLGDSPATFADNLARFEESLQAQGANLLERYFDAVHVVDVFEARSWEWKQAAVLGMVRGEFPSPFSEDIYLRDRERGQLNPWLPTSVNSQAEEELLFCFACSRAEERLIFCHHTVAEDGSQVPAGVFLDEVRRLIHKETLPQKTADAGLGTPTLPLQAWMSRRDGEKAAWYGLGRVRHFHESRISDYAAGENLVKTQLGFDEVKIERRMRGDLSPSLSEPVLPHLSDLLAPFSISSVETFGDCPFKSFGRALLALKQPEPPVGLTRQALGDLAHKALQQFFSAWKQGKPASLVAIFKQLKADILQGIDPDFDQVQELDKLQGALARLEEAELEDWLPALRAKPLKLEWSFGYDDNFHLKHNGRSEPFKGRIDRIDNCADGLFLIDYKLGKVELNKKRLDDLRDGWLPQLPVYVAAAESILGKPVAGVAYESIKRVERATLFNHEKLQASDTNRIDELKWKIISEKQFREMIVDSRDAILSLCEQMRGGDIDVRPRDPSRTCGFGQCKFYDVCRVDL